jgi:hypothetical protein
MLAEGCWALKTGRRCRRMPAATTPIELSACHERQRGSRTRSLARGACRSHSSQGPVEAHQHRTGPGRPPAGKQPRAERDEAPSGSSRKGLHQHVVRPRPTLPPGPPGSTIGAGGLSFRVRNGTGRFPTAMAAVTLRDNQTQHCWAPVGVSDLNSGCEQKDFKRSALWSSPRPISTGPLHTSRCFHARPINPVVCREPYPIKWVGDLILKQVSRLDAFSGYPSRT